VIHCHYICEYIKISRGMLFEQPFVGHLMDNKNIQRNLGSDTKNKAIERESKNTMWVWERKLSKIGCLNIISQISNTLILKLISLC